jgi:hypothetical protein
MFRAPDLIDDMVSFDLAAALRGGLLERRAVWVDGIRVSLDEQDGIILRDRSGEECRLALERTANPLGVGNLWLACPTCGRRCRKVFAKARDWVCRRCSGGIYATTRMKTTDRLERRLERLKAKVQRQATGKARHEHRAPVCQGLDPTALSPRAIWGRRDTTENSLCRGGGSIVTSKAILVHQPCKSFPAAKMGL